MKKIVESTESLSDVLLMVKQAINDETNTIALYDQVLKSGSLSATVRPIIEEIRDDEKDHLVLLTHMLQDLIEDEMPGHGEENMMQIVEDEDDEEESSET